MPHIQSKKVSAIKDTFPLFVLKRGNIRYPAVLMFSLCTVAICALNLTRHHIILRHQRQRITNWNFRVTSEKAFGSLFHKITGTTKVSFILFAGDENKCGNSVKGFLFKLLVWIGGKNPNSLFGHFFYGECCFGWRKISLFGNFF